jgi:hypothetical protein
MWECKALSLKALKPQCDYLATRPSLLEMKALHNKLIPDPGEIWLIRPPACDKCRRGRAMRGELRLKRRRKGQS